MNNINNNRDNNRDILNLCKYKNIFGEVKTGAHSYRLFDVAILYSVRKINKS